MNSQAQVSICPLAIFLANLIQDEGSVKKKRNRIKVPQPYAKSSLVQFVPKAHKMMKVGKDPITDIIHDQTHEEMQENAETFREMCNLATLRSVNLANASIDVADEENQADDIEKAGKYLEKGILANAFGDPDYRVNIRKNLGVSRKKEDRFFDDTYNQTTGELNPW